MSLAPQTPNSELVSRWGVTREQLAKREMSHPPVLADNERRCSSCGLRVTRTTSGREVGHAYGRKKPMCPEHPDSEDAGGQTRFGEGGDW